MVLALQDDMAGHRGASDVDALPDIMQNAQKLAAIFAEALTGSGEDTEKSTPENSVATPFHGADAAFLTLDSAVATDLREEFECRCVATQRNNSAKSHFNTLMGQVVLQSYAGACYDTVWGRAFLFFFFFLNHFILFSCGHSFCQSCLTRALDHSTTSLGQCPLCRADIRAFVAAFLLLVYLGHKMEPTLFPIAAVCSSVGLKRTKHSSRPS